MDVQTAINNKTHRQLFVSLALRPGTTGTKFYSKLFEHHGIDAEYVACRCDDLKSDMDLVKSHCAGASVTMPYKEAVQKYIELCWLPYLPVNTVFVDNEGFTTGYNCDLLGLKDVLEPKLKGTVAILGSGAMAKNIIAICQGLELNYKQYSRKQGNWMLRHTDCDVLVNTTSIGMDASSNPVEKLNAKLVVDCVIGNTPLVNMAKDRSIDVVTGAEIYVAQFRHQFKIYTGLYPDQTILEQVANEVFV